MAPANTAEAHELVPHGGTELRIGGRVAQLSPAICPDCPDGDNSDDSLTQEELCCLLSLRCCPPCVGRKMCRKTYSS